MRGNGRTAVRGGYGLAYNTIFGAFVGGGELPAALQQVFFTTCLPNCPIPVPSASFLAGGGIPNQLVPFTTPERTRAATGSYVPDQERPRVHTFSLGAEHEVLSGWLGSVRYLHTEGRKLSVQAQLNAGIVPPDSAFVPTWFRAADVPSLAARDTMPTVNQFLAQVVRPLDQYGFAGNTVTTHLPIGRSRYDGVSLELERRFKSGYQFNTSYTWSRFFDHATNEFFNSFINPRRPQDWRNIENEWARSVLDVPHRFVASGIWELPWLRGRSGPAALLGGWMVSAAIRLAVRTAVDTAQPGEFRRQRRRAGTARDRQYQRDQPHGNAIIARHELGRRRGGLPRQRSQRTVRSGWRRFDADSRAQ